MPFLIKALFSAGITDTKADVTARNALIKAAVARNLRAIAGPPPAAADRASHGGTRGARGGAPAEAVAPGHAARRRAPSRRSGAPAARAAGRVARR